MSVENLHIGKTYLVTGAGRGKLFFIKIISNVYCKFNNCCGLRYWQGSSGKTE